MVKLINALGAEIVLPLTISFTNVPIEVSTPIHTFTNADGGVKVGRATIPPRRFSLEGSIYKAEDSTLENYFDDLVAFLLVTPIDVYRLHDSTKFLRAYTLGAPHEWANLGREISKLSIQMVALDPYWYGAEKTEPFTIGKKEIVVEGSVMTYPLIITASTSDFKVENEATGQVVEVVNGISGVYRVDNVNHTVTVGEVNTLGSINDDWRLKSFCLIPGKNKINVTGAGVSIIYRPRWL